MRVLLVEDDTASARSIEMMLKAEGYVCDCTDPQANSDTFDQETGRARVTHHDGRLRAIVGVPNS